MSISVGDKLPAATFKVMTADGPADLKSEDIFPGKKVVLFAVPGAFTPTCHRNHMPGFLENYETIVANGVDTVACVAVNDVFVMDAWGKATGADGKILMLSDGNADFAKAIGMDIDGSGAGLGTRSMRYSMVVDDGTVRALNVEDAPGEVNVSGAAALIETL
ncbi:peroxiredoxin [Rhodobium gokarnense]|uniref:Glutathione-dependent peroxiredoxin n=1 Tax=Rhodobium gokarnense TaxID=364296 RepID=A0ABT3HCW3_9HYPH|nr:peroxiredoxin [Rhodobium gokarnense]MCW2308200.1 peroxiredoxin [Rhodobium gokarnense]